MTPEEIEEFRRSSDTLSVDYLRHAISDLYSLSHHHSLAIASLQIDNARSVERDHSFLKEFQTFASTFKKHDESEMAKYDKIDKRLGRLEKIMYIGAGVVAGSQLGGAIGWDKIFGLILKLIGV